MGNRAVITDKSRSTGLYLHWDGSRSTVEALLEYCKRKGCRGFGQDTPYALARLVQVAGNYVGGTLSVGVLPNCKGYGEDNGTYVVDGWDIVERWTDEYDEETEEYKEVPFPEDSEQYEAPLTEMLEAIDENQPERDKLGDLCRATLVPTSSLKVGDIVYVDTYRGVRRYKVLGIGDEGPRISVVNNGDPNNPNNYIHGEEVYKV